MIGPRDPLPDPPPQELAPGRAQARPGWGRGCPFPSISLTRATSPRSHKPSVGRGRHGAAERPDGSPRKPRALAPVPSGARFGFPQVYAVRASGLRESPGFGRLDLFGIPWILSSEMSLFNGLHATPGPFLIHAALSPEAGARRPGRHSIRRSTALKPLAKQKPLGAPGSWQSTSQGSDRALG